jgi:hypothetical protein
MIYKILINIFTFCRSNFASERTFAWVEKWNLNDAENRKSCSSVYRLFQFNLYRFIVVHQYTACFNTICIVSLFVSYENLFFNCMIGVTAVRRLMETDNKKDRASARKAYNSSVRGLVAFVKRRDTRFIVIFSFKKY